MRKLFAMAIAISLLSACTSQPGPGPGAKHAALLPPIAKPGDVVATELAFARYAAENGRWVAFSEYSDEAGVMFVPEMVNAKVWLKGRAEPATQLGWEPYEVWSSCDGSIGVTRGGWHAGEAKGWFTTVWKRQKDGSYRWLLDHGDVDPEFGAAPEFIEAHVADCPKGDWLPPVALTEIEPGNGEFFGGASDDATLRWGGRVDKWGGRIVTVDLWDGAQFQRVLHQTVAPPPNE